MTIRSAIQPGECFKLEFTGSKVYRALRYHPMIFKNEFNQVHDNEHVTTTLGHAVVYRVIPTSIQDRLKGTV